MEQYIDTAVSTHILGDCFDVMKRIPNNSVDLILTDPPYEISQPSDGMPGGCWGKPGDPGYMSRPELDFGDWDHEPLDLDTLYQEFYRILKPSGSIICFYDIWKMESLKSAAMNAKFSQPRLGHWQKTNPVPLNSKLNYLSNSREYFASFVKGSNPTFHSKYDIAVYEYPIVHGNERLGHPTQKPVGLIKEMIIKHSNSGEIIFDPFAGTNTTAAAAVLTNRKFISIEKTEKYYNIGKTRIQKLSGNKLLSLNSINYISV